MRQVVPACRNLGAPDLTEILLYTGEVARRVRKHKMAQERTARDAIRLA